jgi:hypothetical protein
LTGFKNRTWIASFPCFLRRACARFLRLCDVQRGWLVLWRRPLKARGEVEQVFRIGKSVLPLLARQKSMLWRDSRSTMFSCLFLWADLCQCRLTRRTLSRSLSTRKSNILPSLCRLLSYSNPLNSLSANTSFLLKCCETATFFTKTHM